MKNIEFTGLLLGSKNPDVKLIEQDDEFYENLHKEARILRESLKGKRFERITGGIHSGSSRNLDY